MEGGKREVAQSKEKRQMWLWFGFGVLLAKDNNRQLVNVVRRKTMRHHDRQINGGTATCSFFQKQTNKPASKQRTKEQTSKQANKQASKQLKQHHGELAIGCVGCVPQGNEGQGGGVQRGCAGACQGPHTHPGRVSQERPACRGQGHSKGGVVCLLCLVGRGNVVVGWLAHVRVCACCKGDETKGVCLDRLKA